MVYAWGFKRMVCNTRSTACPHRNNTIVQNHDHRSFTCPWDISRLFSKQLCVPPRSCTLWGAFPEHDSHAMNRVMELRCLVGHG
eukprot:m.985966 g.985966  ORF g.985966 m.985966 type:complete len:84 (+) comp23988_c0_seq3:2917-3168(+)